MNTLNGYSKSTLTDSNVLSAAGGHLPLVAGRLWRSWTSVTIEEANVVWYIKVELPGYSKPSSMLIYGSYNNIDDQGLVEFSGFSKGYIYRNINQNGGNVTAVCMSSVYDSTTKKWTFWIKMRPINNSSDYYAPDQSATYLIYFSGSYTITATATTTDPGVEWLSTSTNLVINNAALIGTATTATAAVSANKIPVTQNTNTDAEWPIVWSNQNNTNSVTDNQLYKSYNNLTYNPKNQRITALLFRGSLGDGTITVKGERNNEINFGGTNASTTIYFGYRATDSKPIPSQFVFGSSTGTAEILASKFTKAGGTSAQFLKADGSVDSNTYLTQHQSLANYVTLNTNQTITGTKTFSKVINIANSGGSWVSGMTNAAIKYDSLNALNTGHYHPIIGVKTNGENVVNFGAYVNSVGFYGYKKGRTANDTDWIFTFNSETGAITHTGTSIKATKFIKSGGTSAQFLKADGSIDSNTYATTTQLGNYLPLTGGTMTGVITIATGNLKGLKFGTSYLTSLSNQLIWQSAEAIRFGSSDWNWNSWAGLKYDHPNKTIYLGLADNSIFTAISGQYGGKIKFPGVASLYMGNTNLTASALNIVDTAGSKDLGMVVEGSSNKIGFIIGSGNVDRGIYDYTNRKWIFYKDASATYITDWIGIGSSTKPVYFTGGKPVACGSSLDVSITGNANTVDGKHASDFLSITPTRFSQYKSGNWTKILTFTIPVNSLTPSISFTWHPTECARYAWSDFNINIRSGAIIFMANWKGDEVRTLKCVGDGTTYNVWVYGIKEGYDPYGSIQVTSTYDIISYQAGSLAYQDADPTGTYTADATKYGAVSSADKLSTVSKTAWGQTYWTSGGVPTSISGNISSTGNITPSATHTYTLGSSSLVYERVYCRYIDTDSGYNLRLCAQGSEKISINAANGCVGINNTSPTHQLTVSGTGYFTRQVRIDGVAASQPLVVRGIVGQNGSGTVGELYLQYGANSGIFLGNTGAHTISADGSKYSGNAATSSRLSEYYELNRSKDSEIIAPKDMPLGMFIRFKNNTGAEHGSGWNTVVAMNAFTGASNSGAGYRHEFLFSDSLNHSDGTFYVRNGKDDTWNPWRKVLTDYNWISTIDLSSYATKTYVDTAIANAQLGGSSPDLELYFRPTYVNGTGFSFASNTSGNAFTIYAPTSAGASNQILISTGNTPSWTNQSNLSVGNSTKLNGQVASYYAAASALDGYLKNTGGTITGQLVLGASSYDNTIKWANTDFTAATAIAFMGTNGDWVIRSTYTEDNSTADLRFNRRNLLIGGDTALTSNNYTNFTVTKTGAGASGDGWDITTTNSKHLGMIGTTVTSDLPLVFTNLVNTSSSSRSYQQLYMNANSAKPFAYNPGMNRLRITGTTSSGQLQLGYNNGNTTLVCNNNISDTEVMVQLPDKDGVLATLDMIKWAVYYVSTGYPSYTKQAGNHNFISSTATAGVNTGCAFNISYPSGFNYTNTIISAHFGTPTDNETDFMGKTISMWPPVLGVLGIYVGGYQNGIYSPSLAGYNIKLQFMCINNI